MCAAEPARRLGVRAELARCPGFGPSLRGFPLRLSCVEHRESLLAWLTTSTVLRRVLRGALETFVAPVVDVNDIFGVYGQVQSNGPAKS